MARGKRKTSNEEVPDDQVSRGGKRGPARKRSNDEEGAGDEAANKRQAQTDKVVQEMAENSTAKKLDFTAEVLACYGNNPEADGEQDEKDKASDEKDKAGDAKPGDDNDDEVSASSAMKVVCYSVRCSRAVYMNQTRAVRRRGPRRVRRVMAAVVPAKTAQGRRKMKPPKKKLSHRARRAHGERAMCPQVKTVLVSARRSAKRPTYAMTGTQRPPAAGHRQRARNRRLTLYTRLKAQHQQR